jgi:hypothetical protein
MKLKPIYLAIMVIVIILISIFYLNKDKTPGIIPETTTPTVTETPDSEIMCTMDVKTCPDGSYVSRVAPDCEFAPCE